MRKNKYIIGAGVIILVLVLSAGGYILLDRTKNKSLADASLQSANAGSSTATSDSTSGLSVGSSSPNSSLNQLMPSSSSNSSTNAASNGNLTGSQSSSSSSSSSALNPATFSQYNKYLNNTSPLFGDIQVGSGTELTSGHKAAVYYKGWLTNGTLFDETKANSSGQVQPFVFTAGAGQVIPGWDQGLIGMKVGGIRLLIVPPAVGYGDTAQGSIPADSVLVFEVQLVAVQ